MLLMPTMPMTSLFAALLGLMLIALSANVIRLRQNFGVLVGDAGNETLQRAIRAQCNFSEYVPLSLILIALLELQRTELWILFALGMAMLIGRMLHMHSLTYEEVTKVDAPIDQRIRFRKIGMMATLGVIGVASLLVISGFIVK